MVSADEVVVGGVLLDGSTSSSIIKLLSVRSKCWLLLLLLLLSVPNQRQVNDDDAAAAAADDEDNVRPWHARRCNGEKAVTDDTRAGTRMPAKRTWAERLIIFVQGCSLQYTRYYHVHLCAVVVLSCWACCHLSATIVKSEKVAVLDLPV